MTLDITDPDGTTTRVESVMDAAITAAGEGPTSNEDAITLLVGAIVCLAPDCDEPTVQLVGAIKTLVQQAKDDREIAALYDRLMPVLRPVHAATPAELDAGREVLARPMLERLPAEPGRAIALEPNCGHRSGFDVRYLAGKGTLALVCCVCALKTPPIVVQVAWSVPS